MKKVVTPDFSWRTFWKREYVTYRRFLLDTALSQTVNNLQGRVLDVGGKRENKRGAFRPQYPDCWVYINLDESTQPDILADVQDIPLPDGQADYVVCTETIEHVQRPDACIAECRRLLKDGGSLILSVPFLYPVHADPQDYRRYTRDGILQLLQPFASIEILAMGGIWGVLGMFLEISAAYSRYRIVRGLMWRFGRLLQWIDARLNAPYHEYFTTGYFVTARKA